MRPKSLQLCPTLCDAMHYSSPDSSVHRNLQTRILEWVANALFQGIVPTQGSNLHLLHWQADSLSPAPSGKRHITV